MTDRGGADGRSQRERRRIGCTTLLHVLSRHSVPTYLLHLPTFVQDPERLFEPLSPLLTEHGVSRVESTSEHERVADADRIHTFER